MPLGKSHIITHRGLEPSNPSSPGESTYEAFKSHLSRGFAGIEFDPNPTIDGIVVWHDANLKRLTNGKDDRAISEVSTAEMVEMRYDQGHIPTFDDVMGLIRENPGKTNALHLKSRFQNPENLALLIDRLRMHPDVHGKLIIFDIKPETAREIKTHFPTLRLAPSVAHPSDIERFNDTVGGTLISIEEAISLRREGVIDGIWGDEWDLKDGNKKDKKLYTRDNFDRIKSEGLFIALVTPELHATSPSLYGGESHPDARDTDILFKRIEEIIDAGADYLCTDYPEEVAML